MRAGRFDVGDTESEPFWTAFLRSLKDRGLDGVQLVISDAHTGLKKAIATTLQGSAWQRCRVHFMRNVLVVVPKGTQEMVASIIRTIFAQPDTGGSHRTTKPPFCWIAEGAGFHLPRGQSWRGAASIHALGLRVMRALRGAGYKGSIR